MNLIPRRLKQATTADVASAALAGAAALGIAYAALKSPPSVVNAQCMQQSAQAIDDKTGVGIHVANYVMHTPMGLGACALKGHADQLAKPAP